MDQDWINPSPVIYKRITTRALAYSIQGNIKTLPLYAFERRRGRFYCTRLGNEPTKLTLRPS